jgi:hypothetical protein
MDNENAKQDEKYIYKKVDKYYSNKINNLHNLSTITIKKIKSNDYIYKNHINQLQQLDSLLDLLENKLIDINNICENNKDINKDINRDNKKNKFNKSDLDLLFPIMYYYFNK